jgi:hypothetical protein
LKLASARARAAVACASLALVAKTVSFRRGTQDNARAVTLSSEMNLIAHLRAVPAVYGHWAGEM